MNKVKNRRNMTPFECRFDPLSPLPFPIYFFNITLLFLILDIEIILVFSIIPLFRASILFYITYTVLIFIISLLLGL